MINVLLLVIALVLTPITVPGLLATVIESTRKRSLSGFLSYLSQSAGALALALDMLGNVMCKDLFDWLFVGRGGYSHGKPGKTVSRVLGINKGRGTLAKPGISLAWLLNLIDPGHVERAAGLPYEPGLSLWVRLVNWFIHIKHIIRLLIPF